MSNTNTNIIAGMKYEALNDDKIIFYRILKKSGDNKYEVIVNGDFNKTEIVEESVILNNWVSIMPDAFINMMVATINDATSKDDTYDVYVCANKSSDMLSENSMPGLILRQNVYSPSKNFAMAGVNMNQIYVGECVTTATAPDDIKEFMNIKEIKDKYSVAYYINDSQDDILKFIRPAFKQKVKTTLNEIESSLNKLSNGMMVGFSHSLSDLMNDNGFMPNLLSLFNITMIDFPIDLGGVSHNKEGDIVLNTKQIDALQNVLKKYIANVTVLEYDNDIDISNIVTFNHIIVSDSNSKIYLIAFDTIGYIDDGNEDITTAMMKNV